MHTGIAERPQVASNQRKDKSDEEYVFTDEGENKFLIMFYVLQ